MFNFLSLVKIQSHKGSFREKKNLDVKFWHILVQKHIF